VWYGGQFCTRLFFLLTPDIKVPAVTAQIMIVIALALGTPGFVIFGWLSTRSAASRSSLTGFLLAAVDVLPDLQGDHRTSPIRSSRRRSRRGAP